LSFNAFSTVDLPTNKKYPSLTDIYLSSNKLSSWLDVCRMGHAFPSLSNLVLINNPLSHLDATATSQTKQSDSANEQSESHVDAKLCFPALKSLNISETQVESWEELENLKKFPCLTEVRLTGIPFIEVCFMCCIYC
jgi:tubulin-specific chaperone cofactor E-like protein